MGHHDWVSKEVNETGEMRWVERDTVDKTGTHQRSLALTTFAFELLFLETFLNGTDFGLTARSPLTRFQRPHLTENTCHEKSDFYIIIMIIVYVL
jgi:hypothetical protein